MRGYWTSPKGLRHLSTARRERGMTQRQLAAHIGKTLTDVALWESATIAIPGHIGLRLDRVL